MAVSVRVMCINKSDRLNPHERILYIGGVTKNDQLPKYRLAHQSWLGTIDRAHPDRIAWRALDSPPTYMGSAEGRPVCRELVPSGIPAA